MTANMDENLRHEKMQAEIAKIFTEIEKMRLETTKINSENQNHNIGIEEIRSRIDKSMAETAKISSENRWYPAVIASGATLAIVAVVKLFL